MAELIKMTDELAAEIAAKFDVSTEYVWEQYAEASQSGPEAALADMDAEVARVEENLEGVIEVAAESLDPENRLRAMATFYSNCIDALDDPERRPDATDLILKLAVALYKLAEAQERIAELSDGHHRSRTKE